MSARVSQKVDTNQTPPRLISLYQFILLLFVLISASFIAEAQYKKSDLPSYSPSPRCLAHSFHAASCCSCSSRRTGLTTTPRRCLNGCTKFLTPHDTSHVISHNGFAPLLSSSEIGPHSTTEDAARSIPGLNTDIATPEYNSLQCSNRRADQKPTFEP